jgi:LPXTG-site transpeptidase (sortase) family protein
LAFEVEKKHQRLKDISFVLSYLGSLLIVFGMILLLVPALPWVYYHINVGATSDEVETLTEGGFFGGGAAITVTGIPTPSVTQAPKPVFKLPAYDASLPEKNTLIIPRIGVNGPLVEGTDPTKMLYKGLWRVPNFGTPLKNDLPIIIAAHRYGYIEWSAKFRKTNSFANLPNMKTGDTFQIVWQQRAFTYKVYKMEENKSLTDYEADVILYTCKYLKSPIRIIVYARRIS